MENANLSTSEQGSMNFGPLFIALAATTWTMDFFSRTIVLKVVQPSMLVLIEHVIITICLLPLIWKSRALIFQFNAKEWFSLIMIGAGASAMASVALSTGYTLGFYQYAPIVALTQQFQPVIAIGLAHLMLKETLPKYYYPLSAIAIGGVFLMYYPTVSGFSPDLLNDLGVLAAFYKLLAAIL